MPEQFAFVLRPAVPADLPYFIATFSKSARDTSLAKGCDAAALFAFLRALLVRQMDRPDAVVTVATSPDDTDLILGWCVSTDDAVTWVYVRSAFRGTGIARALVPATARSYTLKPNRRIPTGFAYRPDLLFQE